VFITCCIDVKMEESDGDSNDGVIIMDDNNGE
jgi:hypothetical protein